jgi:ribosomal protein L21E
MAPCQGIQFDESIGLQGISGQICTGPTGTVITARGRCPIVAVTRIDKTGGGGE